MASSAARSVVIIDDHDIIRVGLESLVLGSAELRLVGSADTLQKGLSLIAEHRPDVVFTDMTLPDSSGLDTVRAVVAAQAGRGTVVVSMQDEILYGQQVLAVGANAYVRKETAHANALVAASAVLRGEQWVSPALAAKMLDRLLSSRSKRVEGEAALTVREVEILELLRTAKTTKEIATTLGLSARTVDLHRAAIKKKLGLRTGVEVVAYAMHRL